MSRQKVLLLETEQAGTLSKGDEFKFQPGGPGTRWDVFTFDSLVIAPKGEWVDCYGGEPIRAQNKHDRAWRSFDAERIRKEAQPPGTLASGRRVA